VMIEQSLAAGTEICYVTHGMQVEIGGIFLRFYDYTYDTKDENQRSLIVLATVGDKKCLYMGDAGFYIEEQMLRMGMSIEADILKVGHHGSNDASSHQFLSAVSPDYAVICVGQNTYGHPSLETTKRIENVETMIYRTDICNSVTFTVHQESLDVSVE
ncbi:MAG: hypothetical protein IKM39_02490, partial [Clostridia bacterium]|nr:hypothetical protein [Clostridia bacterium]